MAIDNLNFYNTGLPAGQLTDRYSSQPGCLRSKNLDIFSSSKSVKATAWSQPTTTDADIVKQDGKLVLKTDGKVYERENGTDTLFIDPSTNFPIYDVSYTGASGTYAPATRGTPQDMVAKYEGNEWKSFVVYTDRASFVYSKEKFLFTKSFSEYTNVLTLDEEIFTDGYLFRKVANSTAATAEISIKIENATFTNIPIRIYAKEYDSDESNISLDEVAYRETTKLYYDAQLDGMKPYSQSYETVSFTGSITAENGIEVNVPITPNSTGYTIIKIKVRWTAKEGQTRKWNYGELYIDMNGGPVERNLMKHTDGTTSDGDCNYYYSYLPLRERKLTDIGSYGYSSSYWMKGQTFQALYKWTSLWVEKEYGNWRIVYDFIADMGWESDPAMDIIGMVTWDEQVYMIGNLDGDGYIIPCDLSGGRGTPFIAYGCTFRGVANINYLMYLVGDDRGISRLWVYNGQELVAILGGNEEKDKRNLIKTDEQYRFDGRMVEYRGSLILSTEDNRIFAYGQTYGGKGGTFIHELPGSVSDLKAEGKDLVVAYNVTVNDVTTKYVTKLQDDTPIKNYNTEWTAEYPIVLGNHLLEKEESDLYASYILPSSACKLEFWGMANHYHFWTFKTDGLTAPTVGSKWYIDGSTGSYWFEFIEKNEEYLTMKLVGDLPVITGSETLRLRQPMVPPGQSFTYISYSDFNHFRKIGEITTSGYQEGEFRFTNLNNKLELPKSHSLQIMVKGKGTVNYTPELFALDLVANQRDRG